MDFNTIAGPLYDPRELNEVSEEFTKFAQDNKKEIFEVAAIVGTGIALHRLPKAPKFLTDKFVENVPVDKVAKYFIEHVQKREQRFTYETFQSRQTYLPTTQKIDHIDGRDLEEVSRRVASEFESSFSKTIQIDKELIFVEESAAKVEISLPSFQKANQTSPIRLQKPKTKKEKMLQKRSQSQVYDHLAESGRVLHFKDTNYKVLNNDSFEKLFRINESVRNERLLKETSIEMQKQIVTQVSENVTNIIEILSGKNVRHLLIISKALSDTLLNENISQTEKEEATAAFKTILRQMVSVGKESILDGYTGVIKEIEEIEEELLNSKVSGCEYLIGELTAHKTNLLNQQEVGIKKYDELKSEFEILEDGNFEDRKRMETIYNFMLKIGTAFATYHVGNNIENLTVGVLLKTMTYTFLNGLLSRDVTDKEMNRVINELEAKVRKEKDLAEESFIDHGMEISVEFVMNLLTNLISDTLSLHPIADIAFSSRVDDISKKIVDDRYVKYTQLDERVNSFYTRAESSFMRRALLEMELEDKSTIKMGKELNQEIRELFHSRKRVEKTWFSWIMSKVE